MTLTQSPWSLTDLFPGIDSPELDLSFKHLEAQVAEFEESRAELKAEMAADKFLNIVSESEKIMRAGYRVYGFTSLSFAANTQDQAAQALLGRVQQFFAEMQNRTLFFSLWWKDLDDANAARLMDASGDYRYYLEEMRHYKPHTLSEPEEKIVNIKNVTGMEAMITLYDAITNRYVFKV
jgi:oligoendopeptidase F